MNPQSGGAIIARLLKMRVAKSQKRMLQSNFNNNNNNLSRTKSIRAQMNRAVNRIGGARSQVLTPSGEKMGFEGTLEGFFGVVQFSFQLTSLSKAS